MKVCKRCGAEKPLSEFNKNKSLKDGLFNTCKACERARREKYRRHKGETAFRKYTPDDDAIIVNEYPHCHTQLIAEKLGRTFQSVATRASRLGVKKTEDYMKTAMDNFMVGQQKTRYKKGHVPWSAGRKIGTKGRSGETQFKKGYSPHNYLPVGSIRKTSDGYWQKKMTDTGYPPNDWVMVSHLIWQELNGPLPDGYVIKYMDDNKDNLNPGNLQAMSREDCARLIMSRIDPGIKKVNQLLGAIQRQLNKREKNGK